MNTLRVIGTVLLVVGSALYGNLNGGDLPWSLTIIVLVSFFIMWASALDDNGGPSALDDLMHSFAGSLDEMNKGLSTINDATRGRLDVLSAHVISLDERLQGSDTSAAVTALTERLTSIVAAQMTTNQALMMIIRRAGIDKLPEPPQP